MIPHCITSLQPRFLLKQIQIQPFFSLPTSSYLFYPPSSSVRRAPLLRLEFTCFSRTELTQVKNYFEKFANFNFPRQQIHYPRCNGLWLKEISAQKVRKGSLI